ncbi:LysR family transcriptional regulator [Thiotrichales bacterium 19S3-7]|nr:LysR family transcriptional regulator [Thiotrichales bacterium 19S3-7]MCF6801955.1 LysR family transcriptional regulator [Thiotrichales bacterium 19S3-11]
MNFNDLQYFVEVAKKESITYAAERIGISQPSLSLSIKRLEATVGTKLFNRFKTGVKLTPSGKILFKRAKELEKVWNTVKYAAYDANHKLSGTVTIGCHSMIPNYHLPRSFFNFIRENDELNVRFSHVLSREINEAVINFEVDLGIVVNPNPHPDLVIKKMHQDQIGLWHNFKDDELDLGNITIICDMNLKQVRYLLGCLKQRQDIHIKRIIESNSFEVLGRLMSEKVGVAMLPKSYSQSSSSDCRVLFEELYFTDTICLVYRHENRYIKSVASIIELLSNVECGNDKIK